MATIKAGDTWPPLRGSAGPDLDGNNPADLASADSMILIIKHSSGAPLLEVTAVAIDPTLNDGDNWEYELQDGDTDVIGDYKMELEVTWDAASTPPKVQTFPNVGTEILTIEDDLGGAR